MEERNVILLVEDNDDDVILTLRALRRSRIANEIEVAKSGEDALDVLAGAARDINLMPSVVLLDLNLPRMTGIDVLRTIRADEATRLLPVIVLTSSKRDEDVINSYSLGANAYVRKPVDFEQFVDAIKRLDLSWRVLNEAPLLHPR